MADQWDGNRTEAPTPRRREEARKQGQVVFSPDLTSAWLLLVGCGLFLLWGGSVGAAFADAGLLWLGRRPPMEWGPEQTALAFQWLAANLICTCALPLAVVGGCGLAIGFLQSSWLISLKPLTPNWEKLSLVKGFSRLASPEAAVRGLWAALRFIVFLAIAAVFVWWHRERIVHAGTGSMAVMLSSGWELTIAMALVLAGCALVPGVADYLFRWVRNESKLRMSRTELKEEQKEEQGDPLVRGAIRRQQREQARRHSIQQVPQATVVITNPTHLAVALRYELGQSPAPRVIAKGAGLLAQRIKEVARKHHVPLVENKPLARALYQAVPVGEDIPLEFYRAVAEILAELYRQRQAAV